jgi:molecular chaperone DnaK
MILGIDLGTTNSAASYIKNGKPIFIKSETGSNTIPSVVHLNNDGTFIVGEEAKKLYTKHPDSTIKSVKSFIGTNQKISLLNQETEELHYYSPTQMSAEILKEIKRLAEKQTGETITEAVITVPAYFDDIARKETIKAGKMAGLKVSRIINEPTAAALSYSTHNKNVKKSNIMIYDLGGGTFDTSIVEINEDIVEVTASDGNRALGGDDFDYALCRTIYKEIKDKNKATEDIRDMAFILTESEKTKQELSKLAKYSLNFEKIGFSKTIYRNDLEEMIENHVSKTITYCESVIKKAGLTNSQIDKILLVGGSSKIPFIKELLESHLGVPVSQEIDPDLAVVTGAAIQAAIIEGQDVESVLLDVVPHSLSVSCSLIDSNGKVIPNYCTKIINKNSPLPCYREEMFSTEEDKQKNVKVSIYQGESDFENENTLIKELKFDGLRGIKSDDTEILVNFSYNLDGTVEINLKEEGTDNKVTQRVKLDQVNL